MSLNRKEFDVLTSVSEGKASSLPASMQAEFAELTLRGLLVGNSLTEKGVAALEPYRVKRAVFLAAGFGSRMAPVTYDTPKPLINVNGVRIIDTLLDAVVAAGITEIYIVRGYKGEQFDVLKEKYPTIQFVENPDYDKANNILSAYLVHDKLANAYVFESDLFLKNPGLIRKYQYESNYVGVPMRETEDWCFTTDESGRILSWKPGGKNCYLMFGICYLTEEDGLRVAKDTHDLYETDPDAKTQYWDWVHMRRYVDDYCIYIRPCTAEDATEFDTLDDLVRVDPSYEIYKNR